MTGGPGYVFGTSRHALPSTACQQRIGLGCVLLCITMRSGSQPLSMLPAGTLLKALLPSLSDETSIENITTTALVRILQEYPDLQESLVTWIFERALKPSPGHLRIDTQRSMACSAESDNPGKKAKPDILFTEENDCERAILILENKLKARLTQRQPVDYIRLLVEHRPAGMVVIAPSSQIGIYKRQCQDLCERAGLIDCENRTLRSFQRFLDFLSWQELMSFLYNKALSSEKSSVGEMPRQICDLSQLKGLMEQMEEEKIDTFSSDDLALLRKIAYRIPQLYRVLEKVRREFNLCKDWSHGRWATLDFEGGVDIFIWKHQFWLLPDFKLLSSEPSDQARGAPVFWLRYCSDYTDNKSSSDRAKGLIRLAMNDSSKCVINKSRDCFSMALPFHAEQSEDQIINLLIESIKTFEVNLAKRLER